MFDLRSFHNYVKKKYDHTEMPSIVQISDMFVCFVLPQEIRIVSLASVDT